jgi:hypothetical protein
MTLMQVDWNWFATLALLVFSIGLITGLVIPTIKQLITTGGWTLAIATALANPRGKYELWLAWFPIMFLGYLAAFVLGYYAGGSIRGYLSRYKLSRLLW